MAAQHEPAPLPPEAVATDVSAALGRAVAAWSEKRLREAFPRDRVVVMVRCAACELAREATFLCAFSPATDPALTPLYRSIDEVRTLLTSALTARPAFVTSDDWTAALACPCGAPVHNTGIRGAALLHAMIGSGAGLVATVLANDALAGDAGLTIERWPDGARFGAVIEASDDGIDAAFGRALTLFSYWEALASQVPADLAGLDDNMVMGTGVEPGVFLIAARTEGALAGAIGMKLDGRRSVVVRLDAGSARAPSWPALNPSIADRLDAGAKAALVVERDAMLAQARMWARARMGMDVRDVSAERIELVTPRGSWPIAPAAVALSMVQLGRSLSEACAFALSQANDEVDARVETLERLVQHLPGASFDVVGTKVTARMADGRAAREIDLFQLPADAGSIPDQELARQAAFLFDAAPAWADRLGVCSCGAAASLERKLVAWPWEGEASSAPWVVETWGDDEQPKAAEVLAVCCDLHVQVLAKAELERLGLTEAGLKRRLFADVGRAGQAIEVAVVGGQAGAVLIARGPFVAGTILVDGHLATLNGLARDRLIGEAVTGEAGTAFALGPDMLAVTVPSPDAADRVRAALLRLGYPDQHPFVLTRNVDLHADPIGKFAILGDTVTEHRAPPRAATDGG